MKLSLKLRSYPESRFVSVWLLHEEGAATSSLLFGELLPAVALALVAALGLPVSREAQTLPGFMEVPVARLVRQQGLFEGKA